MFTLAACRGYSGGCARSRLRLRPLITTARFASVVDPPLPKPADEARAPEASDAPWRLEGQFFDRDYKPYTGLKFVEEPLGLWWGGGAGWPRIAVDDCISSRDSGIAYCVFRKLGWGLHSSVWLAGNTEGTYVALKVLTGFATKMNEYERYWEAATMRALKCTSSPYSTHVLELRDEILLRGKEESDGEHLCLVTDLHGGTVEDLRSLPPSKPENAADDDPRPLPIDLSKRILLHVLRGIAHTHRSGFVHTDVQPSNVLFSLRQGFKVGEVTEWMASDPPRHNPPEVSDGCTVQSVVSHPVPLPSSLNHVMNRAFVLADFGFAQPISKEKRILEISTPAHLRPPEVILGGSWDEKVDIWLVGCMAHELLTGEPLFRHEAMSEPAAIADPDEAMLYQMMSFTGEDISPEQLNVSKNASMWFEETCEHRATPPPHPIGFKRYLRQSGLIAADQIHSTAMFLHRCLCLNPDDRPSAEDLLRDPWFEGVE